MRILILLDNRDCHVNPFHRCVSLQVDPIIPTSARSSISSSQCCLFHLFQVAFVFPPSHPFLPGTRFLIQVSFYCCEASPFFLHQYSYPVILKKILTEPQVHNYSFFFFFGGFKSSFVDHIPFIVSNAFHAVAPLNHPPLAILYLECWRYIKRFLLPLLIRSTYFEDVISFKPFNSTSAIFLQIISTVYLLSGP